ncbi:MAG: 50S ribosomal protein L23 [Pseudomonadota bacterium]|uniref:50S ribosomal protein L23 n=1 Tax=Thermithiobacillus tepidarius TaxID=929 RepID=UPI000403E1F4|nr:50S ribosomal protein L23 [Thermithiobacillus tepidarius]
MNQERTYLVLQAPLISEKATRVAEQHNQFVFKVALGATKLEIKKAVEALFNVKVRSVQTINYQGKAKRFGRYMGRRSNWKKAYVCLEPDQELDLGAGQ